MLPTIDQLSWTTTGEIIDDQAVFPTGEIPGREILSGYVNKCCV